MSAPNIRIAADEAYLIFLLLVAKLKEGRVLLEPESDQKCEALLHGVASYCALNGIDVKWTLGTGARTEGRAYRVEQDGENDIAEVAARLDLLDAEISRLMAQ